MIEALDNLNTLPVTFVYHLGEELWWYRDGSWDQSRARSWDISCDGWDETWNTSWDKSWNSM